MGAGGCGGGGGAAGVNQLTLPTLTGEGGGLAGGRLGPLDA